MPYCSDQTFAPACKIILKFWARITVAKTRWTATYFLNSQNLEMLLCSESFQSRE